MNRDKKHRIRSEIPRLLTALTVLVAAACARQPTPASARLDPAIAPGANGRSVLWIKPLAGRADGSTANEHALMKMLHDADVSTDKGVRKVTEYLANSSPRIRQVAVQSLAESTRFDAMYSLLASINDPHWRIAQTARRTVSALSAADRLAIWELAVSQKSGQYAEGAASMWPHLVSAKAITKALVAGLDPAVIVRLVWSHCTQGLSKTVMDHASAHENAAVRAVVEGCMLLSMREPTGRPKHLAVALNREKPMEALVAVDVLSEVAPVIHRDEVEELLNRLDSIARIADGELLIAVAAAQVALGRISALEVLANRLKLDESPENMHALTRLRYLSRRMSALKHPALADAVIVSLANPDAAIRARAAAFAGDIGDARVVSHLVTLMKDSDDEVRARSAYSLGRLGSELSVGALVDIGMDDANKAVADMSYAALHRIVHGLPLPPYELVSEWLSEKGDRPSQLFWGRDRVRWRRWYQLER